MGTTHFSNVQAADGSFDTISGDPVLSDVNIVQTVISGGAAGDLTLTGVATDDVLKSVLNLTDGTDVTDEFSITAADTINNTGGTATTGDTLLVMYVDVG